MNRRNDTPGELHPGGAGFPDSQPDQYAEEHHEHREYGRASSAEGQARQGQHVQHEYQQHEYEQGPHRGDADQRRCDADQPREAHAPQPHRSALGPQGYQRSDERLREHISESLMQARDLDSSDVTVQVLGGQVVLEGTVPDRRMKHAIEDLAAAAPGVQDVDNRIRVADSRYRGEPSGTTTSRPTRRNS